VPQSKSKKLTPKEVKFCLNYLANGQNATHAYRDAGYTAKNPGVARIGGFKTIRKPHIKQYINEHLKKVHEKLEITIEWKMKMLKECVERCAIGEADKDGKLHPSGLIGAIAELNKMQGHLAATKTDNTHIHGFDDELTALIDKHSKEY
jgi:hypothetical protein